MNERIRQLAEQADAYAWQQIDEGADYDKQPQYFAEKFAELIVQQCLRMCDCAEVSLLEHSYPREADGAASVKIFIKEHFGVEE